MDSLLANYASSSDEEKEVKQPKQQKSSSSSLFSSLPPPSFTSTSTSTSTSLQRNKGGLKEPAPPASFSSLPPPSSSVPKRVVEFRPPPIKPFNFDDDEDEEADRDQKRRKESQSNSSVGSSSVKSFLSSIPAPKNSFSALGGRRSAIDTQTPTSATAEASKVETHPASNSGNFDSEAASYAGYESGVAQNDTFNTQPPTSSGSDAYGVENHPTTDYGSFDPNAASYANNETGYDQNPGQYVDAGYGSYEVYGHQHGNNWGDGSVAAIPQTENALRILGKRSKIPAEIVEVKQDELMKNRPREDQSKMTGIAFGPSYQPVSSKGKPTKLHKRKHQIGSLFFDMKQKEMELAERRSKGFLTKAETHAKYGW